jgi:hypothetical protein
LKHMLVALVALILAVPAFADNAAGRVFFVEPADGAKVPTTFKVKFGVEGMTVVPAGAPKEGTGHHHLLIDRKNLTKGTVVPTAETSIHYGKGQTETELTLKPGKHTLTLQFADGNHQSYGPEWSSTITVDVQAQPKK